MQTRNGGRDRGAFSQVACEGARGTSGAPTASGTVAAHGRASKLPLSRAVRAEGPSCRERHRVQADTGGRTWQRAGWLLVKGPFLSDYGGNPRGGTLRRPPLAQCGDAAPAHQGCSAPADRSHRSRACGHPHCGPAAVCGQGRAGPAVPSPGAPLARGCPPAPRQAPPRAAAG